MSPNINYCVDGKIYKVAPFAKKHNKIELVSPIDNGEYYTHKILTYEEFLDREGVKTIVNDTKFYNIGCNTIKITNDVYVYNDTHTEITCRYKNNLLHGEYTVSTSDYTINCNYNNGVLDGKYIKTSKYNNTKVCDLIQGCYRPGVLVECTYDNGTICSEYYRNEDIFTFRYDGGVHECYHHYCSLSNYEQEYLGY